jgi:riboflavin biosynthesis pyrimidine reductase
MTSSLDGRLHPSRWTSSAKSDASTWSADYELIHRSFAADGWIVGRATMAEMAGGDREAEEEPAEAPPRRLFAQRTGSFAIAVDPSGRLRFDRPDVGGDHVMVLLGRDVSASHLAGLARDGVSYVVADDDAMDLAPLLGTLRNELGVRRLLLEGGAVTNGGFLAAGLVDELHLVLAPALDGSPGPAIVEAGEDGLKGRIGLSFVGCEVLESGALHLRYAVEAA